MQVPFVAVKVYGVVIIGDASGFKILGLLSPVTGDQKNEVPFDVAVKVVVVPSQIVVLLPAFTVNVLFKVTVTGNVAEQLLISLTVTE